MSDVDRSNNPLEVSECWGRDSTLSRDSDSRRFSMPRRDANFSGSSNASPEIAATVNPANAVAEGQPKRAVKFNPATAIKTPGKSKPPRSGKGKRVGFQPVSERCTPRIPPAAGLRYQPPSSRRAPVGAMAPATASLSRPDYDDTLRRVSVVLYQHVKRCEAHVANTANPGLHSPDIPIASPSPTMIPRAGLGTAPTPPRLGLPASHPHPPANGGSLNNGPSAAPDGYPQHETALYSARDRDGAESLFGEDEAEDPYEVPTRTFHEDDYTRPQFVYCHVPMPGMIPGVLAAVSRQVKRSYKMPTVEEIYGFAKTVFDRARLTAECSVVCLVYVERLMAVGNVLLLAHTWRPVLLCGLLLASKVWQDLATWNVEFAQAYPEYPLQAINNLERAFLGCLRYELYISTSVYAKYYFALRALGEQADFRKRFMLTMAVAPSSRRIEQSTKELKAQLYSRSV